MGDDGLKWVTMGQETNSSTTESSRDLNLVLQQTDLLRFKRAIMEQETNSFTTESSNNEEDYLNPPLELKRPWSDLPCELLEQIEDPLAIVELLSFRGTCREWRRVASFKASAHHHHQTESSTTTTNQAEQPWFLLYDCIVCVSTNTSYNPQFLGGYKKFVLHVLGRGANEWDKHEFRHLPHLMNIARCAMFSNGIIYFLHSFTTGVAFSLEEKQWKDLLIVQEFLSRVRPKMEDYFSNGDKGKLGLKDIDSLSICGTEIGSDDNDDDDVITYIYNKEIKGTCTRSVDDVEGVMKLHHSREEGIVELLRNEVEVIVEFLRGRPLLHKPKNKCGVPVKNTRVYGSNHDSFCFLQIIAGSVK
ncbi:F-box domain [Macleaya cordata]|uniref:F-box domain n=1 Tax=Macleaya cordata TaxID=56857 RepID=A0A200QGL5_MACCD|nr:F-box domain [Macleaya cordata]